MSQVTTIPAAYIVTALPADMPESYHFHIHVDRTAPDTWAVRWNANVYNHAAGIWEYEIQNSSRTDEWKAAHRLTLEDALALAEKLAPTLTVNGWTVQKVLARGDLG
jgi:hypothetical protein